jgi:hypothetical protein
MPQRSKRHGTLVPAVVLGASLAMTTGAMTQGQFARECALKDIAVITLIEEHGAAANLPGARLGNAMLTILDARSACAEGRVGEALALYQTVLDIGPVASLTKQRQ